jgi:hypothetical protein
MASCKAGFVMDQHDYVISPARHQWISTTVLSVLQVTNGSARLCYQPCKSPMDQHDCVISPASHQWISTTVLSVLQVTNGSARLLSVLQVNNGSARLCYQSCKSPMYQHDRYQSCKSPMDQHDCYQSCKSPNSSHHDSTDRLAPTRQLGYHCPLSVSTSNNESNVTDTARKGKDGTYEYVQ